MSDSYTEPAHSSHCDTFETYTDPTGKVWHCNANDKTEWFFEDSPDWEDVSDPRLDGRRGWMHIRSGRTLWEPAAVSPRPPQPPPPPRRTVPVVDQNLPDWLHKSWDKADEKEWTNVLKDLLHAAREVNPDGVKPRSGNATCNETSPAGMCMQIAAAVSQPVLSQLVRRLQGTQGDSILHCWWLFIQARQISDPNPQNLPGAQLVRFVATALVVVPERLRLEERPGAHRFEFLVFELARKLTQSHSSAPHLGGASIQASSRIPNKRSIGAPQEGFDRSAWMHYPEPPAARPHYPQLAVVTLRKNGQTKEVELPVHTEVGELARKYGGTDNWEIRRADTGLAIFDSVTIDQLLEHDNALQLPLHLNLELLEFTF